MAQISGIHDLLDDDDFLSLTTVGPAEKRVLTVSLQKWTTSLAVLAPRILWQTDFPNAGEPQVFATFEAEISGCPQADVRIRNDSDGHTIKDKTITASDEVIIGPEPHVPRTTGDPILIKLEAKATHGGTITVRSPVIRLGIGN